MIAHYPLSETAGTVANNTVGAVNGLYTNVTLDNDTFINGDPSPLFVLAAPSKVTFAVNPIPKFNGLEGSLEAYFRIAAAVWIDTVSGYLLSFGVDGTNYFAIEKSGGLWNLAVHYFGAGVSKGASRYMAKIDWFQVVCTWSKSADRFNMYIDSDLHQSNTGLGLFTSAGLTTSYSVIGAQRSSGFKPCDAEIARVRVWNRVLSQAEITAMRLVEFPAAAGVFYIGDSKMDNDAWTDLLLNSLTVAAGVQQVEKPFQFAIGAYDVDEMDVYMLANLSAEVEAPTRIIINLGANDIPVPTPEVDFKASYNSIVTQLKTKWPGVQIYLSRIWRRGYAAEVLLINGYINDIIAATADVNAGDDESVWLENGDDGVTYTDDGVHYNPAAQPVAAAQWITALGF